MAATALLTVTTTNLSFGQVVIGKSSALSVALTNAGNSDVTVSKVSVSGAHFSANGVSAGLILAPGQSVTLDATFTPAAPGTSPGSVTVASNAANSPETITLSGDGMLASSRSVEVTWTPSTSAVAGYHVYRSEISGGPYSKLDSNLVAADSFADSRTQAWQTYYYVVTSVTVDGVESPNSSQSSATIPTP
jgi:fibronectin type 3 domain-containing protein